MTMEAICFDLDDTLYAYEDHAEHGLLAAADLLEERTGEQFHDELLAMYFEEGLTDGTFDRLLDRHDLPQDLAPDLVEAYHGATDPLTPYEPASDVLSTLGSSYQLGLITDGRAGLAKLDRLGLREHFDAVLVTPTIDSSKHDPAVFERVLSELSVDATAAAYVGDDPRVDFRNPNELGMATIRLRRGRFVDLEPDGNGAAPDTEIDSLDELLTAI